MPELPDFSMNDNIATLAVRSNESFFELQTQTSLLTEQNSLLRNILGLQRTELAVEQQRSTASSYHRAVRKLNNITYS